MAKPETIRKATTFIAVDPDVEKSGWAMIDTVTRTLQYGTLPFPELLEFLVSQSDHAQIDIEAGWLNEISNYHGVTGKSGMKIAKNVGANHQTGRLLIEMLEHYGVKPSAVRPLKKCWRGRDGKITAEELNSILVNAGFSPMKRSSQDARDAVLLAFNFSELPMIVRL